MLVFRTAVDGWCLQEYFVWARCRDQWGAFLFSWLCRRVAKYYWWAGAQGPGDLEGVGFQGCGCMLPRTMLPPVPSGRDTRARPTRGCWFSLLQSRVGQWSETQGPLGARWALVSTDGEACCLLFCVGGAGGARGVRGRWFSKVWRRVAKY